MVEFFVTLDGPGHTYNSSLIMQIIANKPNASDIYQFNSDLMPNWTGHTIMILLNLFFTPHVSEKILLCSYIIALPFSFRMLVRSINPQNIRMTYLIFPFIYSFLLHAGFYNFCIGIVLFFSVFAYWLKNENTLNRKNIFTLSLLLMLIYFSHPFVFVLFCLTVGIRLVYAYFFSVPRSANIHKIKLFLAATLPSLSLLLYFIMDKSNEKFPGEEIYLAERIKHLFLCRPLITLIYDEEKVFSAVMAVTFFLLVICLLVQIIRRKAAAGESGWLLSLIFLIAYLFVPNNMASGGFISIRILLFFYFSLMLWFVSSAIPLFMQTGASVVSICVSLWFLQYHHSKMKDLDQDAKEYFSVTKEIKNGSLVLPLSYSDNWLHINLYSYIGTVKNITLLDNYEAESPHFPLTWKKGMNPYEIFGKSFGDNPPCADIDKFEPATGKKIDYVIRWRYRNEINDSCTLEINKALVEKYDRIFVSAAGKAEVFQIKK